MNMPISFHDVETLSAYLDNQLTGSEKARIEFRLKNEPALSDALNELSQSRSILRKLPVRRAPRNFTLTPKMAGIKPPVPRAIPVFRMASAFAAVLFLFAFLTNISVPALAALRAAAPPVAFGMGGGGGGGPSDTENPAASEAAPAAPLAAAPMTTATPGIANAEPAPTLIPEIPPTAQAEIMPKAGGEAPKQQVPLQLPIPAWLQLGLLGLAVITGGVAYILTARSDSKWYKARALSRRLDTNQIILIILAVLLALALALTVYYVSTATFFAPVSNAQNFPGGGDKNNPPAVDKGPVTPGDKGPTPTYVPGSTISGGNKGGGAPVGAQGFTLTVGMGYNFSSLDPNGLITAIEFQPDTFPSEMLISYIPGVPGTQPVGLYFPERSFSLVPADKNSVPQKPFNIVLDYSEDIAKATDENALIVKWWNGTDWQDAATTCSPASEYQRAPIVNRLNIMVCQMGSFVLSAP